MSRASKLASYLLRSCALLCSPFSAVKIGGPFSLRCQLGGGGAEIVQVEMLLRRMAGLAAPKASVVLEPMLAFVASHEACRRMAVCTRQQTGNYTTPASREARCRAAVSPQPTGVSPEHSRALWARCGVKGYYPLREARCRAAVKPSQAACLPTPLRARGAQKRVQGFSPACGGSRGGAWGRRQRCRCPRRRIPFRKRRCEQGSACRR